MIIPVVTITHGKYAVHVNARVSGNWREFHRYTVGYSKPNYPMPVTIETTETALIYLHLALCPLYYEGKQSVPCEVCIDRFLDALEGECKCQD